MIGMRRAIHRVKSGTGFSYKLGEQRVSDKAIIERIDNLAIPPAWSDVMIASSPKAKIQVQGRDASGKKQYIYNARYVASQGAAKFDRTVQFALKLPTLRRRIKKDLKRRKYDKNKVIACAIALMDKAHLRVGNEKYAKQHASYGVTTLRRKHVLVHGETIVLDFIGKSGKQQHKELKDQEIAKILKKLDDMPGHEIFRYFNDRNQLVDLKSDDVNQYIRDAIGQDFSAKDFRTWAGTMFAALELAKQPRPHSPTERKRVIVECVQAVADELGNTPAVARASYIDPFILKEFERSDRVAKTLSAVGRLRSVHYLSKNEQSVIKLLSNRT